MSAKLVHMIDMIRIILAFTIIFLIRILAFLKMVEESFVGHDVRWIERTFHSLNDFSLA